MTRNRLFYSDVCPDTEAFIQALNQKGIAYQPININESIANLKEFLNLRDQRPEFRSIKANNRVGVPVLVTNDQIIFEIENL